MGRCDNRSKYTSLPQALDYRLQIRITSNEWGEKYIGLKNKGMQEKQLAVAKMKFSCGLIAHVLQKYNITQTKENFNIVLRLFS